MDVPDDLPLVRCDFKQIQQALLNIMINGSEAMDTEGTLTVRAKSSIVKGMVRIDISDTGHGIPKAQLGNIFEPFSTTKPEGKGVGLGLAVVYGIITRHGGSDRSGQQRRQRHDFHDLFAGAAQRNCSR